jgi:RNase adapter protein RapZ
VFLDCDDDVLIRRFTETRRRHPLATDRPVADGIAAERRLLAPIRDIADVVIDSSHLSIAAFRRLLSGALGLEAATGLAVSVVSFGFRYGLPREADMVFDVRFLANPHYDAVLRPHDGRQPAVAAFVAADPDWPDFFERLTGLVGPLLPRFAEEGKSYLTLAIGCTGGRHRSVFAAERLADWLKAMRLPVTLLHRDVDRAEGGG